jgi:hypothetical protein
MTAPSSRIARIDAEREPGIRVPRRPADLGGELGRDVRRQGLHPPYQSFARYGHVPPYRASRESTTALGDGFIAELPDRRG